MIFPTLIQQSALLLTQQDEVETVLQLINHIRSLESLPAITQTHPSIRWINSSRESVKIATIRELTTSFAYAHETPHYYCVLAANKLTLPAQHALLKSLEEPPLNVRIILCCNSAESLLETIQSRCQVIVVQDQPLGSPAGKIPKESKLLTQITQKKFGELIDFAENHTDSEQVRSLLSDLLLECENERREEKNTDQYTTKILAIEQTILNNLQLLDANCTALLVGENTLITLKQILVS
jgi:hypothetical protein